MNFVVYVLEKFDCVVWFSEIECFLQTMCLRIVFLILDIVKMSDFLCSLVW